MKRFVELAGGTKARILVVPTAAGLEDYEGFDHLVMRRFREYRATEVRVLHARTRAEADTDAFVAVIEAVSGIWFTGGRQWRLADTYLDTKAEAAMRRLLRRGGVIGGGSAGATIIGSYLVRGDTRGANEISGDHDRGFGFLMNVAVDQHLLARNRQFDLVELIRSRPELLGVGIDENAAIVVQGDRFEVVGDGYVAIYDPALITTSRPFYFLRSGDYFDLRARKAYREADDGELWAPQLRPHLLLTEGERQAYYGLYASAEHLVEVVDDAPLAFLTGKGERIPLRALERDLFFEKFSGAKVQFSFGSDGCVTLIRRRYNGQWVELRRIE